MSKHVGQRCGDYRLVQAIGEGGFAEVYLGEHLFDPGQKAAVKLLKRGFNAEELELFRSEAQTITHLKPHPHIIQLSTFGETILHGEHVPFLVMDYAPHGSLDKRHPAGTRLPMNTILAYLKPLAEALQFAHEQKIVHRDVKPANFLLGEGGTVFLSDFGIAVLAHQEASRVEQKAMGSWQYTAPEQFSGNAVPASDQYALAIVVYRWLCGELPFQGNYIELAYQHRAVSPPPLHEKIRITPYLEQAILRALAKEPEQRFPSVQDFVFALDYTFQEEAAAFQGKTAVGTTHLFYGGLPSIAFLAWSADGTYITATSPDCAVQVWDARNGKTSGIYDKKYLPAALRGHSGWQHPYSPDGHYIVLVDHVDGKRNIRLQKVVSGETQNLSSHHDRLAWSPDGQHVAITIYEYDRQRSDSETEAIVIRDIVKGTIICTCRDRSTSSRGRARVETLAWSPDGRHIAASYSDDTVRIWDAVRGRRLRLYQGIHVHTMAWSPDGQCIASDNQGKEAIDVWNPFDGKLYSSVKAFSTASRMLWSPDPHAKYLVVGCYDEIRVVNATNGTIIFASNELHSLADFAWSPDGTLLAAGSSNGEVRVWNLTQRTTVWVSMNNGQSQVDGLAWSPNGLLLASESFPMKQIRVWGSKSGKTYATCSLQTHYNSYSPHQIKSWKTSTWSPDGTRVATRYANDGVAVWNPADVASIAYVQGHTIEAWALPLLSQTSAVYGTAWSPDGQRATSANAQDGALQVKDATTNQLVSTYRGHARPAAAQSHPQVAVWSPDGKRIASTDPVNRRIHIWDPTTGKQLSMYHGYVERVSDLIWTPDSEHIVSFGLDKKELYVWNATRGETLCIYKEHQTSAASGVPSGPLTGASVPPVQALL